MLAAMRERKRRIKAAIQGIPGLAFRHIHDPEGDAAIALIMLLPTVQKAREFSECLSGAWCIFKLSEKGGRLTGGTTC